MAHERMLILTAAVAAAALGVRHFGENLREAKRSRVAQMGMIGPRMKATHARKVARAVSAHDLERLRGAVEESRVYVADEILVAPRAPADLDALAAAVGGQVIREVGRSGVGVVRLPDGADVEDALRALHSDPRVRFVAPQGVVRGAGASLDLRPAQWHLAASGVPQAQAAKDLSKWVVAVLDTGVAYERYEDDLGAYVRAPSLAGSRVVAPLDLVQGDAHPNDDHQHGTHVASVLASSPVDSPEGRVQGVAPGVSLLPVKVLDDRNVGVESDLVEGIHHAIAHGAHIINLSLAFNPGYVPSRALDEALRAADAAGVLVVAAAGNDGAAAVSWPAASPLVLGVGAGTLAGADGSLEAAEYANLSPAVDLVAPGGSVAQDHDGNGHNDGVVAQSISAHSPEVVGAWAAAGSSQAAAVVSGALVHLLDAGLAPRVARNALLLSARDDLTAPWTGEGHLRALDLGGALSLARSGGPDVATTPRLRASIAPALARGPGQERRAAAAVRVVNADRQPVVGAEAWVDFQGDAAGVGSCVTDAAGQCVAWAPPLEVSEGDTGAAEALAFAAELATVVLPGGLPVHPTPMPLSAPAAGGGAPATTAMAAWSWPAGASVGSLGPVEEATVVVNAGASLAVAPLGVLFTSGAVESLATVRAPEPAAREGGAPEPATVGTVDFDQAGRTACPLGIEGLRLATQTPSVEAQQALAPSAPDSTAPGATTATGHPVAEALRASGLLDLEPVQFADFPQGEGATEVNPAELMGPSTP